MSGSSHADRSRLLCFQSTAAIFSCLNSTAEYFTVATRHPALHVSQPKLCMPYNSHVNRPSLENIKDSMTSRLIFRYPSIKKRFPPASANIDAANRV